MKHSLVILACAGFFLATALNNSQADPPNGEWKTMYGVEIKQNSSSDPWVRIAKYDTWAGADTRVILMMRHGGQAAVRIAEFREFVPARIIATPRVVKNSSPRIGEMKTLTRTLPVQTRVDSGLIGKTIDAAGNRGIIIVGGRQVDWKLTLPLRQPGPALR